MHFRDGARDQLSGRRPARRARPQHALALGAALVALVGVPARAAQLDAPPASYPRCRAAQLAGFPWTHRAYGKSIPGIGLRNLSLQTCRLSGYVTLRAYDLGAPLALRFDRKPFVDTEIYPYAVRPGAALFFALYGNAPHGEFDRSCVGITQIDLRVAGDRQPIDVTISTGTCGGRMNYSQIFPVSELALSPS